MARNLILIPTRLEQCRLSAATGDHVIAVCGFGPIAAGLGAAKAIAEYQPQRVALVGIAGSYYKDALPPGSAACFDSVTIDGIGAGQGDAFKTAASMGFGHLPDSKDDLLALNCPAGLRHGGQLLTACAASGSNVHALMRRDRYPQAAAEDMEGFAVALACRHAGMELTIIRGISNLAGQRDVKQWVIDDAMSAASELLNKWLAE